MTVANVEGAGKVFGPTQEERMVAWVRHWRPILEPALRRRHPAIATKLFDVHAKDAQDETHGIAKTFLGHLDDLRASSDPEAAEVLALIAKKGIDARALAELRDATNEGSMSKDWPGTDFTAAEKRLWDWYIEWSAVVRARIRDKRLRRELGISESHDDDPPA